MTELEALKAQIKSLEKKVAQLENNTLYAIIEDWWSDIFTVKSSLSSEESCDDLIERIKEWLPKPQSAEGSQSVGVEELVTGWNDCLETIKRKLG